MVAASNASTLSPRGFLLLGAMRRNLELLVELEKAAPRDVEEIVLALIAHLRSWKPLAATAAPAAMLVAPVAVVASEAPAEGAPTDVIVTSLTTVAFYELSTLRREAALGDGVNLYLHDDAGHDANVVLTPTQAGAFGRDFARVLAKLGEYAKAAR